VIGLLRLMSLFRSGSIDSRSGERASHHATRSPDSGNLVVAGGTTAGYRLRLRCP
jgi:hypothetical protein